LQNQIQRSRIKKYKCYKRKHSLSLAHTDLVEYKEKKFILFEDDASCFILAHRESNSANKINSIKVFKKSLKYWIYKQLHSDNDSVFRINEAEGKKSGEADFQKEVKKFRINQIFTRVRYPWGHFWSKGKFIASVGFTGLDFTISYVLHQEEHHFLSH
jgi:hypothetical protein